METEPAYFIRFWAKANAEGRRPWPWEMNVEGETLADVIMAAQRHMTAKTYPSATHFTIHDAKTSKEVFRSNA